MSAWPGKIVIGLTGNIATGKSVIRKMLEDLGAYGIDADALAHQALSPGSPGYHQVVQAFGTGILQEDGQINRNRLGQVVFSDANALSRLEAIIHPIVKEYIDAQIQQVNQPVIVIEAIKLIEAEIHLKCDALWVVYAPRRTQRSRLMKNRHLDKHEAELRIDSQPPQEQKMALADVVIDNSRSISNTRSQVQAAWQALNHQFKNAMA